MADLAERILALADEAAGDESSPGRDGWTENRSLVLRGLAVALAEEVTRAEKDARPTMLRKAPGYSDDRVRAIREADPKYVPLTIRLESLPARSIALGTTGKTQGPGKRDGYVLWYFAQSNRIMTPAIRAYDGQEGLERALVDICGFMLDTTKAAVVVRALENALDLARAEKLEQEAKAGAEEAKREKHAAEYRARREAEEKNDG